MGKALIKGSLLGGIVVFIWMMISWMLIPWHCAVLDQFKNEDAVAQVIMENAPRDGVYVLPNMCDKTHDMEVRTAAMKKGPVVFASVQRYGFDVDSFGPYLIAFIIQLIGAFLVTLLLLKAKGLSYWSRVLFVTIVGLTVGILGALPAWNWWGFTFGYVAIEILDYVIAWWLAGLVIAAVAKRA